MKLILAFVTWILITPAAFAEENPAPPVASYKGHRAIYCSGTRFSFAYSRVEAVCVDVMHGKFYTLSLFGLGASYQIAGTVFRLAIDYDSDRYDANFDPIPGQYFAMVTGFAVGPGYAVVAGSAGNKAIFGRAYNIGLGMDYTLASMIVIQ